MWEAHWGLKSEVDRGNDGKSPSAGGAGRQRINRRGGERFQRTKNNNGGKERLRFVRETCTKGDISKDATSQKMVDIKHEGSSKWRGLDKRASGRVEGSGNREIGEPELKGPHKTKDTLIKEDALMVSWGSGLYRKKLERDLRLNLGDGQ